MPGSSTYSVASTVYILIVLCSQKRRNAQPLIRYLTGYISRNFFL